MKGERRKEERRDKPGQGFEDVFAYGEGQNIGEDEH
jgi:hypothetical protein